MCEEQTELPLLASRRLRATDAPSIYSSITHLNGNLIVPERRVVLQSTIRNFSDLLEPEAAHLSEPP